MSNSSMNNAVSGLKAYSKQLEGLSSNISNADTVGHKEIGFDFFSVVTNGVNGGARGGGGVKIETRQSVDRQGALSYTERDMDLAIDGQGMFVANNKIDGSGDFVYTRAGSLRTDEKGNFITANGDVAMLWKYDSAGRRPGDVGNENNTTSNSLLSSLSPFNINDIKGIVSATTEVKVGITLDMSKEAIKGSGDTIQFRRGPTLLNSSVKVHDVIVPTSDALGSIAEGDSINVRSNPPDEITSYKYGGVARTNDITAGTGILGATKLGSQFANASDGHTLKISSAGVDKDFVFKTNGFSKEKGEFNSMSSLAEAINYTPDLTARIVDNRIYISSKHGDKDLKFTNSANGGFVAALGLKDVAANSNRFSTLAGLKSLMNNTEGMKSNDSGTGGIDFYADSPTGTLKVFGDSFDHKSNDVRSNVNSNLVTIMHTAHGLTTGDYINVANFTGADGLKIPDGSYMVVDSPDADSFILHADTKATAGSAGAALPNTSINWTKGTIGFSGISPSIMDAAANVTTTTGSNIIQINASAAHGLVDGDIAYMSGLRTGTNGAVVKDGYYRVSAVAGNNFSITVEKAATTTAAAAPVGYNISWKKVADTANPLAAKFADFGTSPIETTKDSSIVKVYSPNAGTNYQIGDAFHFGNIDTPEGELHNGIFISKENSYLVRSTGSDAQGDYITFEAKETANKDGYIADASLTSVSNNKFSKFFKELGISVNDLTYGPSYSPDGGEAGPNFSEEGSKIGGVYSQPLEIHDSLGQAHSFMMTFGKIENNKWAVEIYSPKNKDGTYDVNTGRSDGQVAAGTMRFNGDGSLSLVDDSLLDEVEILWKNGAEASKIKFDWGKAGASKSIPGASSYGDSSGMQQIKSPFDSRFIEGNGVAPSEVTSVTVNKNGIVIAKFANGKDVPVGELPLGEFNDVNGLTEISGNAYKATYASGTVSLKRASDPSVGKINSQNLEKSNSDLSTQLTNMIVCQRNYQANTKVVNIANQLLEALDRVI